MGLPGQGVFDWTDRFLEQNPGYVELSDRKLLEWAQKSGCQNHAQHGHGSTDHPFFQFGNELDDQGTQ